VCTSKTPVPTFIKQVKENFFQQRAEEREREVTRIESEMNSLAKSTLPACTLHKTAYIVDLLAVIQILSKGKMKTFGELTQLQQLLLLNSSLPVKSILSKTDIM